MNVTKTEWFFIVNPHAGSGKTMSQWVPAEQKIYKLGIPYVVAYTDHRKHATALAYEAASKGYRRILAVGGDGSLHETFNGIMQWCDETGTDPSEFIMSVAPIGSGNDWIKSLNLPHDTMKIADLLAKESFGKMDIIRLQCAKRGEKEPDCCYMANIGGTGFDSHVCEKVNRQKERGHRNKMIYLNALKSTVLHLKPISLMVLADGKEVFNGSCYSIALGNGRYSGGGMLQVPKASMDDGLLDVTIIPRMPLLTILKEMPKLFTGKLDESEHVIPVRCRELHIIPLDAASEDIIELDGEIEGRLPATFTVTGNQIGVLKGIRPPDERVSEDPEPPLQD